MFSQYFGHYLLNQNYITQEQLLDALEDQKSIHVKFGVIAVDKGLLNSEQIHEIHEKQKQVDKRFGEIAIELGYLTEKQVNELVSHQKQGYLYLAQALINRGYMTMDQFVAALNDYKKEYGLSDEQFKQLQNDNVETIVQHLLNIDSNVRNKYCDYIALFAKNFIRFIDQQVYLEISDEHEIEQNHWIIYQTIVGESPLFTGISIDNEVLLYIASKYAEEEITEVDEMAKDSVSEFLNLNNGIYLVNMSNNGTELMMHPQQMAYNPTITGKIITVNVNTSKGKFQLLLSNQPKDVHIETVSNPKTSV